MKTQRGFTVIELLVTVGFLVVAGIVAMNQMSRLRQEYTNEQKKIAINAMYHSLEVGFYRQHGHYPENLRDDTLPTMDKALLKDPNGIMIGEHGSAYRYEPSDCSDGACKSYTLRATLSGEGDFVKNSAHQ